MNGQKTERVEVSGSCRFSPWLLRADGVLCQSKPLSGTVTVSIFPNRSLFNSFPMLFPFQFFLLTLFSSLLRLMAVFPIPLLLPTARLLNPGLLLLSTSLSLTKKHALPLSKSTKLYFILARYACFLLVLFLGFYNHYFKSLIAAHSRQPQW